MTVCLCGRGADLDKVNKYLSFSPFDIILISEYVDDMKLPDCECYYIAKSEIKNTKSIILQISRKRHLQYTSVVLCKDILLDSKLSKIIFKCSVKNITFVLNINRMFDLHYLDDCRKNISTETHQIIEVFSGRKLPQYHWLFAVLPSVLYLDDDVLSAQLSCDKSCAKIKTSNYEFEIHICDDSSLADQKNNFLVLKKLLLIVAPFSFVMLISYKVPLVLLAIFIQQMSFSYYNCDLDIFIINSIDDLTTSSYYQSMISFVNIIYRMIITLIITASFENLSFNANYIGFTIILFIAYMIDHVLQRRLKNGH